MSRDELRTRESGLFKDRAEAGQALAARIERLIAEDPSLGDPVVMALPRGGVPVAVEIARRLKAPLDLVLVRKIGIPGQPELAAAAVVNGDEPEFVVNDALVAQAGITGAAIAAGRRRELAEIDRRREMYFSGRERAPIEGRTVIAVDDGIATGATACAALKALRRQRPAALILAVPVAAADTLDRLRGAVDRIICLETPDWFRSVGSHYLNFDQVKDSEVIRLLNDATNIGADEGPASENR
jgi:putative phosphoribosyl transferase